MPGLVTSSGRPRPAARWSEGPGRPVQVDLEAQPGAECLDGLGGVVAAPVEAPVRQLLDAPAQRLEQRRHRQGDAGHGHEQVRGASDEHRQQLTPVLKIRIPSRMLALIAKPQVRELSCLTSARTKVYAAMAAMAIPCQRPCQRRGPSPPRCLGDSPSSVLCGPVGFGQVRFGRDSGQGDVARSSAA
jgi:hypothetical protein